MTHWITYSEPSASRLAALLSTMGHQALCEPVTQIDRLLLAEAMPDARPDLIIALSQHAVSAYLENYNKPTHAGALVLAIGPATAAGLIEHGGLRVRVSDPANSEGLLAMSDIAALQRHQTVWLLTGEGGRDMVEQSLSGRCQLIRLQSLSAKGPLTGSSIPNFFQSDMGRLHSRAPASRSRRRGVENRSSKHNASRLLGANSKLCAWPRLD